MILCVRWGLIGCVLVWLVCGRMSLFPGACLMYTGGICGRSRSGMMLGTFGMFRFTLRHMAAFMLPRVTLRHMAAFREYVPRGSRFLCRTARDTNAVGRQRPRAGLHECEGMHHVGARVLSISSQAAANAFAASRWIYKWTMWTVSPFCLWAPFRSICSGPLQPKCEPQPYSTT